MPDISRPGSNAGGQRPGCPAALARRVRMLVQAIDAGDEAKVEKAVLELSRSRRLFAPLAFLVGAFVMLFRGLQLLFSNWRLVLIQILPATWIWLAMFDLKLHLLRGRSFNVLRGPLVIPLVLIIAAVTAASFFLNAVFAFAIASPGVPQIRAGFVQARAHLVAVLGWGLTVGACLGVSTVVFPRWGRWWFAISLSVVIAMMMVVYLALPSQLLGTKADHSKRDQLSATVVGAAIGAIVCTPPYLLGRVGVLFLGFRLLFVPGVILLTVAVALQAGATGAVKAIKMSAQLLAGKTTPVSSDARP